MNLPEPVAAPLPIAAEHPGVTEARPILATHGLASSAALPGRVELVIGAPLDGGPPELQMLLPPAAILVAAGRSPPLLPGTVVRMRRESGFRPAEGRRQGEVGQGARDEHRRDEDPEGPPARLGWPPPHPTGSREVYSLCKRRRRRELL